MEPQAIAAAYRRLGYAENVAIAQRTAREASR